MNKFDPTSHNITDEQRATFKYVDGAGEKYALRDLRKRGRPDRREDRPNMFFPIFWNPKTKKCLLERSSGEDAEILPHKGDGSDGRWRWGRERVQKFLDILEPRYSKKNDRWDIDHRVYLRNAVAEYIEGEDDLDEDEESEERTSKAKSVWMGGEISSDVSRRQLKELFPESGFDYPKPVDYIKRLVCMGSRDGDVVLDFFSGSATTAHAVLVLNAEDDGNRHFILSQLQEPTPEDSEARKAGYTNIAEIGKERIRRAGTKILKEYAEEIVSRETPLDIGFKTYHLTSSTFNVWDVKNEDDIQLKLIEAASLIKSDAKEEDVLVELILKSGYGLTEKIEQLTLDGKTVYSVAGGTLIISLETGLTLDLVRQVAERKPTQFVAREHGFTSDDVLTNTAQIMKDKGIDFRVL